MFLNTYRRILKFPHFLTKNKAQKITSLGIFHWDNPHQTVAIRRMAKQIDKSELKNRLTPMQYHVTQEKGTERPFSGCYNKTYDEGTYVCVVCGQSLFSSETKYDSGCGWPAFNDVLDKGKVKLSPDTSGVGANLLLLISQPGRVRTEVTCADCGSHLGHVFGDGPPPTKKRFCINSASLNFIPKNKEGKTGDS